MNTVTIEEAPVTIELTPTQIYILLELVTEACYRVSDGPDVLYTVQYLDERIVIPVSYLTRLVSILSERSE